MKTFASLLLSLLLLTSQDQFVPIPIADPFKVSTSTSLEETRISGKLLATIINGDFVHPTFSPDANTLAYARVIKTKDSENTEVLLHGLSNHQTTVLLSRAKAWKYATYKASVSDIAWDTPVRLKVQIHDGDVDSTRLILNPSSRRLIREEQLPSIDEEPQQPPIPVGLQAARKRARSLFPELPEQVLDNALRNSAFLIGDGGIVLQKHFHGHDSNVWLLDFQSRSMKSVINLSDQQRVTLGGATGFGSSTIILLFDMSRAYLYQYKEGSIRPLAKIASSGQASIEVKYYSRERVIFQTKVHAPYEQGDNPLFVFDGTLSRVKEYQELYDVDIDRNGRRIAFCYWENGKRKIAIKELK